MVLERNFPKGGNIVTHRMNVAVYLWSIKLFLSITAYI